MSDGNYELALRYDDPALGDETLQVPIRPARAFDGNILLLVDPGLIDPQPMILHDQALYGGGVSHYWELLNRHIFRIPVDPGGYVKVTHQGQRVSTEHVRRLQLGTRVLAGCAFRCDELRVVFDENELDKQRMVINQAERCNPIGFFIN